MQQQEYKVLNENCRLDKYIAEKNIEFNDNIEEFGEKKLVLNFQKIGKSFKGVD